MINNCYTILPNRSGIVVSGFDAFDFLQGLITQDMVLLEGQKLVYTALLTSQGKIDYDFFVLKHEDGYILECESERAQALLQRLLTFKLRKSVDLKIIPLQTVVAFCDYSTLKAFSYLPDPRHPSIGFRKILSEPIDITELNTFTKVDTQFYKRLCLQYGVPNGRHDIAIGEDTVADIGLNKLNGVSYTKGCYIGQELTSRMHHRGLAKKGLYAVSITGTPLPPFTDIIVDGNLIGEMRSSDTDIGLAILRHDSLSLASKAGLTVVNDYPKLPV
jgi:folate-binding protein YgfZ